jgi:hypothetical protein
VEAADPAGKQPPIGADLAASKLEQAVVVWDEFLSVAEAILASRKNRLGARASAGGQDRNRAPAERLNVKRLVAASPDSFSLRGPKP